MVKKEFSEETQSCLAEIYEAENDIGTGRPIVDGHELQKVLDRVRQQPFVTTCKKAATLDFATIAEYEKTTRFGARLDELKGSNVSGVKSAVIELVRVTENPRVKSWNSEIRSGKLYPPRMLVDLSNEDIRPGYAVRINTGYVIRVPFVAKSRTVEGGSIRLGACAKQPDFVVVPLVANSKGDSNNEAPKFITACCPRDPDDLGLLSINLTLLSGKLGKLQIVFNAYSTCRPLTSVSLLNAEPNSEIFKPKDSRSGRLVKNPKVKIHYDSLEREPDGSATLKTFNALVSPVITYEKQRVHIVGQTVLFVNRKREWCNPSIICTPGIYDHRDAKRTIVPKIYRSSDGTPVDKNTHCLVFLESKLTLFSEHSDVKEGLIYLNGAFSDLPHYEEACRSMKQLIRGVRSLQQGYEKCVALKTRYPELDLSRMLRLYDYHRNIGDRLDELKELTALSDEAMFKSQTINANPYSVVVRHALQSLARIFCDEKGGAIIATSAAVTDSKRRKEDANHDDDDNDNDNIGESKASKRVKIE